MPKFLENALRHSGQKKGLRGPALDRYIYGHMNNMGAMDGNKETSKGRSMQKKNDQKLSAEDAVAALVKSGKE